ncbi:MAG: hypothetical protein IKW49_09195 [Opitutales bacterium]|nr:hypothetical protein [Opitutales bacterium]
MLTQIGLAEELGTGMRKISKYIREYAKHGGIEFFDEDLFRARLPLPPEEDSADEHQDSVKKHQDEHQDSVKKHQDEHQDSVKKHQDEHQDGVKKHQDGMSEVVRILDFCREAKSTKEIFLFLGKKYTYRAAKRVLHPLVEKGLLVRTVPDRPTSKNQRYIATKHSDF